MVVQYQRGSSLTDTSKAQELTELLAMYNQAHDYICAAIENLDENKIEQMAADIAGLATHEAYHARKLGILRRVIGKARSFSIRRQCASISY